MSTLDSSRGPSLRRDFPLSSGRTGLTNKPGVHRTHRQGDALRRPQVSLRMAPTFPEQQRVIPDRTFISRSTGSGE